MKSKALKKQLLFLEPGILEGETRDGSLVRLMKVLESKGIRITNKMQEASNKNVE